MQKGYRKWKYPTRTPTYQSWSNMHTRCYDPAHPSYPNYGGRGVFVCERWASYDAFYEDMGERPPGTTLGRIKNDKGYELGNCEWATRLEQNRNATSNVVLTFNGKSQCASAWGEELGLKGDTIIARLDRGATVEEALRPLHDIAR
jgi:hypothetical protein